MAICSISVVPVGTGSTSISRYVALCQERLAGIDGIRYQLTPMATIMEGELETLLAAAAALHRVPFAEGAARVLTSISIDERIDREITMEGKLASVREKLDRVEI